MVWTTRVSSKGQVVLPKAVRERLGVAEGSKIVLTEQGGRFEIHAYSGDILQFYGSAKSEGRQDYKAIKQEVGLARAAEAMREGNARD